MSMVINVASLLASLLALGVSAYLVIRQSALMRHANEVPLLMEAFKEYRSAEFQRNEYYVVHRLRQAHDPSLGFTGLPEEARIAAQALLAFFNVLGTLVVFDMADEAMIVPFFGFRVKTAWAALEPYIVEERKNRDDDFFASFFEDLAQRVRDNHPPRAAYGLKLRRII
jgi:hypothetical protein